MEETGYKLYSEIPAALLVHNSFPLDSSDSAAVAHLQCAMHSSASLTSVLSLGKPNATGVV